ncbi:MAG: pilus assembly protein TadG-related protein [Acidimicrobiales bacterium]
MGQTDELGQVLPMAALLLIPLLVLAAFAVDGAMLFARAAQLQKGADLAALTGAEVRGRSGTDEEATAAVDNFLAANGLTGAGLSRRIDLSIDGEVTVAVVDDSVDQFLSQIFINHLTVGRDATANYGACATTCEQPIVIHPPIPSFPTNGSGDGFVPTVVDNGDRFFALNHHSMGRNALICVDMVAKGPCPGFPVTVPSSTDTKSELAAFEERGELWYNLVRNEKNPTRVVVGLACVRIKDGTPCGEFIDRVIHNRQLSGNQNYMARQTPIRRIDDRLLYVSDDLMIRCFDVPARKPCPKYPVRIRRWWTLNTFDLIGDTSYFPPAVVEGTRLYLVWQTTAGDYALCWDNATGNVCPGFWTPLKFDSASILAPALFRDVDASGSTVGFCIAGGPVNCFSIDGTRIYNRPELAANMARNRQPEDPTVIGTRLYTHSWNLDETRCVDLVTAQGCGVLAGYGFRPYGMKLLPNNGCLVGYGDKSKIFVVDLDLDPCGGGRGEISIAPCTCGTEQFYGEVVLDPALLVDFDHFIVTVIDRSGVTVAGPIDLVDTGGKIDLSGTDPARGPLRFHYEGDFSAGTTWVSPLTGTVKMVSRPTLTE